MPRLSLLLLALPIAPCGGCAVGAQASIDPPSASAPNDAMPRESVLLQEGMDALKAGRSEEARKSLRIGRAHV